MSHSSKIIYLRINFIKLSQCVSLLLGGIPFPDHESHESQQGCRHAFPLVGHCVCSMYSYRLRNSIRVSSYFAKQVLEHFKDKKTLFTLEHMMLARQVHPCLDLKRFSWNCLLILLLLSFFFYFLFFSVI